MTWYYSLNGQQTGPVAENELSRLASAGTVGGATLVWREGMLDWQPVSAVLPNLLASADAADVPQVGGMAVPAAHKDFLVQQIREGVPTLTLGGLKYAGFWMRLLAKLIDFMVLNTVLVAFTMIMLIFSGVAGDRQTEVPITLLIVRTLVSLALNFSYKTVMVGKYGGTLGKLALGLRVVRTDGSKVSMGLAAGRYFAEIISVITVGIGYIIAAFDDEKRALHDHICSTRVIYKSQ
jgi:uncharacterized RDD family membrane protein YckC